jgi:uncharacterized membrane protein YedE/YeeE
MAPKPLVTAFLSGVLFACGLAISGMTLPAKVLGFLDVTGAWDPSLILVMATAIPVYALAWRFTSASRRPQLPKLKIDRALVLGAVLFGLGWGITGLCPGPALVNLGGVAPGAMLFCAAMIAGIWLQDRMKPNGISS